ncbi:MAG TPA: CoA transferase [Caulobacteraceae bacterium]|jgi:crotonobetainyl-CoA:carnitine CoA-transferase CaiB-like acyl-CoA transferase|nr:CoA transferase [Caulobacteraceae bacterium]
MSLTQDAFAQLMRLYGRETPDFVSFDEGPHVLATRFAADEAVSAVMAAGGTVAADLWRLRTGEQQQVEVNTREAAASLTSYSFLRFDDPAQAIPPRDPALLRNAVMGFHPTKDGRHVLLHPSFPPGTDRILKALACEPTKESVEAACMARTAQEIEDAVAAERGCAGVVRTPEEWDASEQGRQLAARPPVEVIKIGDSPPEPMPDLGDMPLSGIRVLDMTRVLAGPTCARTLAQYGADVLYLASPKLPASTGFLPDTNHGKLSAWLDLDEPGARDRLTELLRTADVFSQGYRTGAMERMGFGPGQLATLRPGIVYTSINCYGHEGPWRGRAGWEQLAQTVTGMAYVHGGAAGPQLQPGAVTDYTTGFLAALGSLIALQRRAVYGGSYLVRVSLCQTGMWVRGLGIAGQERIESAQKLEGDEIRGFLTTSHGGYGPISHLRPGVRLSATPARWKRPVVRLGTHPAEWPAREPAMAAAQ